MAILQCNFNSKSLMRTVPVNVVMPTDKIVVPGQPVPEEKPLKTLYLLHGIFGNYTDWVNRTRLQSWAEARNLAVVMPSGDNSFYVDNRKTSALYGSFISKDLVEFTRKTFPLSRKKEDTFIGGLSMGGFGAIVNGLQHPETFGCIVGLSAALVLNEQNLNSEYTDFLMTNRGYYESVFGDLNKVLGGENVLELADPSLGTDDFGYFSGAAPGCYYYIGVGNAAKNFTCPNHNPRFAADPDALPLSAAVEAQAALDFLADGGRRAAR